MTVPPPSSSKNEICFVTTCKGRLEFLKQSLPHMVGQPDSSCVVVDFSCPDQSGEWVRREFPNVKVVDCPGESHFHRSQAKNAGIAAADGPWICLIDADIILDHNFTERVTPHLQRGCFYVAAEQSEGTAGTILFHHDDFKRVGGHDVQFVGWGDEDIDFCDALRFHGTQRRTYPSELVQHLTHDDASRVSHHEITDHRRSYLINRLYRQVKWDLARLRQRALNEEECASLFGDIRSAVEMKLDSGSDADISIDVGHWAPAGLTAIRSLRFRLIGRYVDPGKS